MLWAVAAIVAVYVGLLTLVACSQQSLVYYPQTGREITTTPAAYGLQYEDVSIRTEDGETLHAWWVPAPQAHGAVLLFHGNAGNIAHRIDYARMFAGMGYGTLLVDYRGYGRSSGTPSEEGTYRDATAAWRYLTQTRKLAERDIVVFGESLGGAVAAWLAARRTPRALIIASTFTSVPDVGADVYWFIPVRLLSRFKYDTASEIRNVRAPVLIAHSPQDDIIPYAHGRKLFEAANEPKTFLELGGGHNDGFVFARPAWAAAVREFLERAP